MLIVDGHLDLAFNALHHRRDLTQSVHTLRQREDPFRDGVGPQTVHPDALRKKTRTGSEGIATVSLPELRAGRVGIVLSTIMARVQIPTGFLDDGTRSQAAAHAIGQSHLHYYKALERAGEIQFLHTQADLDAAVTRWESADDDELDELPIGLVLSMESADPILDPADVDNWVQAGLRSVSLTHFGANTWGHGTGTRGGLYACAYPLLTALKEAGIALDVTHAADVAFWQLLDAWGDGLVHASHCMCRALVPGQRHLSDDMIRAIAERGGVIGMVFAEPMLNPNVDFDDLATTGPVSSTRPMIAIADHVDHICQLTGSSDHVAIGSDLDGGFGREWSPVDYDTVDDLQRLPAMLTERGYSASDVEGLLHGNLLRFLRRVMP